MLILSVQFEMPVVCPIQVFPCPVLGILSLWAITAPLANTAFHTPVIASLHVPSWGAQVWGPQRPLQRAAVFLVSDSLCELERTPYLHHASYHTACRCGLCFVFLIQLCIISPLQSCLDLFSDHTVLHCMDVPQSCSLSSFDGDLSCLHLSLAQTILQRTTVSNLFPADDALEMSPCCSGASTAFCSDAHHSCGVSAAFSCALPLMMDTDTASKSPKPQTL